MKQFGLDQVKAFTAWLEGQRGAMIMPPTNEWEAVRFRVADERGKTTTAIIYKNKKGRLRYLGKALDSVECFLEGKDLVVYAAGPPAPEPTGLGRRVTLYTDASFRATSRSGAWAAVLLVGEGVRSKQASGELKGEIGSSTPAEARAVANGLHHFIREKLIRAGDHVTVVCDNTAVVSRLNGNRRRGKRKEAIDEAIELVGRLAATYDLTVTGFWVEGHLPLSAGVHARWNRICDKLCGHHGKRLHHSRMPAMKIAPQQDSPHAD